jgi:hypothetical protein
VRQYPIALDSPRAAAENGIMNGVPRSTFPGLLPAQPRLPLWLKMIYTGFLAVLVPIYARDYGPTNFLYYCDVALFFALGALWLESPLLALAPLVGIFVPQMFWVLDFFAELLGMHLTGLTGYMFEEERPLFTRLLSFFHFWLPFLLIGLVWRLGYDRRAFVVWTLLAWVLMGICYTAMPGPLAPRLDPNMPVNINYVFGMSERGQDWIEPDWYFTGLVVVMPLGIFLPSHLLFGWLFTKRETAGAWAEAT